MDLAALSAHDPEYARRRFTSIEELAAYFAPRLAAHFTPDTLPPGFTENDVMVAFTARIQQAFARLNEGGAVAKTLKFLFGDRIARMLTSRPVRATVSGSGTAVAAIFRTAFRPSGGQVAQTGGGGQQAAAGQQGQGTGHGGGHGGGHP